MAEIEAAIVFEMLGRPAEHLEETMKKYVEKIASEKGLRLKSKKIHDVKEVENVKNVYSTFAEMVLKFDSLMDLTRVLFEYMPAHVEIYSPENVNLANIDANTLLNEVLRKLHIYDDIAKKLRIDQAILENKMKELSEKLTKQNEGKEEVKDTSKKKSRKKKAD